MKLKKKVIQMLKEVFLEANEDCLYDPDKNREVYSQLFLNVLIDWNRKPRVQKTNQAPLRYFYYLFNEKMEIATVIQLNFTDFNVTISDVLKIMEDKNIYATTPRFTAISYSENMEYEEIAFLRLYGQVIYQREM